MNRVYFVGPSGSGKTTLMVSKLYNELQGLNKKQVKLFIIYLRSSGHGMKKEYRL